MANYKDKAREKLWKKINLVSDIGGQTGAGYSFTSSSDLCRSGEGREGDSLCLRLCCTLCNYCTVYSLLKLTGPYKVLQGVMIHDTTKKVSVDPVSWRLMCLVVVLATHCWSQPLTDRTTTVQPQHCTATAALYCTRVHWPPESRERDKVGFGRIRRLCTVFPRETSPILLMEISQDSWRPTFNYKFFWTYPISDNWLNILTLLGFLWCWLNSSSSTDEGPVAFGWVKRKVLK